MTRRDLPLPCKHAPSKWLHRVSSHTDEELDAAWDSEKKKYNLDRTHCSVWVCESDLEAGKSYVAYYAHCTPVVLGKRDRARTA